MNKKNLFFLLLLLTGNIFFSRAEAFDIVDIISPGITQNPVEVVVWVKEGVTAENETRVLAQIREGLDMWESVPTSNLAFNIVQVAHSATEPTRQPHQMLIIVGNHDDLTSGGASFPHAGGIPGTWFGAVADNPALDLPSVTAHEVGHAIGFHHTTISNAFPPGNYPMMHWALAGTTGGLTGDDIAAVSIAYPNPAQPLQGSTGTVRGRLVVQGTSVPVSGVNVVAVNQSTGVPVVARLTGPRVTPFGNDPEGVFVLQGLPPGVYEISYLDGHSYKGALPGIRWPDDGIVSGGLRFGYQADNFSDFTTPNVSVGAGEVVDLGDIGVALAPMTFDGLHTGELDPGASFDTPPGDELPNGSVGEPYDVWLHIAGGLRDITAHSTGLPAGLNGEISGDTRGYISGVHGNHFLHITGTPVLSGHKTTDIVLTDAKGKSRTFAYNLSVGPFEGAGLIAWYRFEGDTLDSSGNGHTAINYGAHFGTDRNGNPNSALYFDGTDDYLEIPHESAFDLPEFTVIAILKFKRPRAGDDWIVSKGRRFGNFTLLRRGKTGTWKGYASYVHQTLKGNWSAVSSGGQLPVGSFFCLAVSVSRDKFSSYVNGQLARQFTNPSVPRYNDLPVIIGAGGYYGRTEFMKGVIDELAIFRGALDGSMIATLCR